VGVPGSLVEPGSPFWPCSWPAIGVVAVAGFVVESVALSVAVVCSVVESVPVVESVSGAVPAQHLMH